MEFNYLLSDFDDVLEYVAEMVGGDFKDVVALANDMLEKPHEYVGAQAGLVANKLAIYRTKIGANAQYFKLQSVQTKKPIDRLKKDACLVLYDALLELVNTLKLMARQELN